MEQPTVTIPINRYDELIRAQVKLEMIESSGSIKELIDNIDTLIEFVKNSKITVSGMGRQVLKEEPDLSAIKFSEPTKPVEKVIIAKPQADEYTETLEKAENKVRKFKVNKDGYPPTEIPTKFTVTKPDGETQIQYEVMNGGAGFKIQIRGVGVHKETQLNSSSVDALKKEVESMIYNRRYWKSTVVINETRPFSYFRNNIEG